MTENQQVTGRPRKRFERSPLSAFALIACLILAQPVRALGGSLADLFSACAMGTECDCDAETGVSSTASGASCCDEAESTPGQGGVTARSELTEDCCCPSSPAEYPAPEPARPAEASAETPLGSLSNWVRNHAACPASSPWGASAGHLRGLDGHGPHASGPPGARPRGPQARGPERQHGWRLASAGPARWMSFLQVARI